MRPPARVLVFIALLLAVTCALAQTQDRPTGVLRLSVRVKTGGTPPIQGLPRKRFFLIPGTFEQNRTLLDAIERQPVVTRECYYKKLGASPELIAWLKAGDCESVYCRGVEKEFVTGPTAVREFATAYESHRKELGSDETARQWLTTNLPPELRDGFYRERQRVLQSLLKQTPSAQSVMTDAKGTAYFTDLEPGTYVLTNLIPIEFGQTLLIWNCEVPVKTGDLASEKPYLISDVNERKPKCIAIKKPMPVCATD